MIGAQAFAIPARLSKKAAVSANWAAAQTRSRALYRQWYRSAPEIIQLYALNVPASAIRAKVRQEFDRNAQVDDVQTVDILLLKGQQEYQETMNCFKMESQIMRWFQKEELPARPQSFLESFYYSRDDPKSVQPTV